MSNEESRIKKRLLINPVLAEAAAAPVRFYRSGRKLLITNPMRMEIARFRRRFLNVTDSPNLNRSLVGLVGLAYLALMVMAVWWRKDIDIGPILIVQAITMMLLAIGAAHSAIASERERKSWDLLQVAPVSYDEIVVGKFMGVLGLTVALGLAFLPAVLISTIFASPSGQSYFALAVFGELLCITASTMVGSFTLWLSARCKSANAALVGAVSTVVGVFVLVPMLVAFFTRLQDGGIELQSLLFFWHPIWVLWRMVAGDATLGIWQSLSYSILTIFFITRASRAVAKTSGKE